MRALLIPSSLLLLVTGCATSAKDTFEDMKKAACAGDVTGFFAHIDRTKLSENVSKAAMKGIDTSGPLGSMEKALAEGMMPAAAQAALTGWEDDIKKGRAGDLCKMSFIAADEREQSAEIKWKTPYGINKTWVFQKFDKNWLAIDLLSPDEPTPAAPPRPPVIVEAPHDKMTECNNLMDLINSGARELAKGSKTAAAAPLGPAAYTGLGESADKIAADASRIDLRDAKLREYADLHGKTMKLFGEFARDTATAMASNDTAKMMTAADNMAKVGKLEEELITKLKRHCKATP